MSKNEYPEGKVRIGVVGAGKMGSVHIRVLSELDGMYQFVGAFDPLPERAGIAERYGGKAFTDYQSLLEEVDAVVIACPTSLHKKMALIAAERNVNVLCEKPVAETLTDAKEMYDTFAAKGLKFTVNHVERFNPVIRTITDIVKGMEIVSAEIHRCSPFDSRIFDVDVVADLMIHDIDLILNAVFDASPVKVEAVGKNVYNNRFADYAQATMTFPSGGIAFITASRCTEDKIRTICIHAKGAYIEGDMLRRTLTVKRGVSYDDGCNPKVNYTQSSVTQEVVLMDKNPLREELVNFGKSILSDEELLVHFDQVVRTMKALDQIEDSLYKGGMMA